LITKTVNLKLELGYLSFQNKSKHFQEDILSNTLSFSQCQNENECFSLTGNCRSQNGKDTKINCKTTGGVLSYRFD